MTKDFFYISNKRSFMTSLEVIREVMNVPMEAIHAIARMNGISTADDHTRNISEDELRPFIEAFERKTRNYFVNSIRNSAMLTPQELQTFTEFCKTFKKGNVSLGKVSNWSHIGKTKLRQYFVDKIKEKTPSSPTLHATVLDLFCGCGGIDVTLDAGIFRVFEPLYFPGIGLLSSNAINIVFDSECSCTEYHIQPSRDLLSQITSDWRYHARIEPTECYDVDVSDRIRNVILSARYYVYIDDDDDHQSDTVSVNGRNGQNINSTLKMVA